MKYIWFLIISFTLLRTGNAQDKTEIVEEYLIALSATMHGESDTENIDQLIVLYSDNIVYEHPKFGMKIESKKSVKSGLMAFLGSYGGTNRDVRIKKINRIIGSDVAAIEFEIRFKTKEDEEVVRKQVQILEIKDGKISRIIDYW